MSSHGRPPKGTPTFMKWLQGLSTRKRIQGEPVTQSSPIFKLPDEIFLNVFSNFPTFNLEHAYYRVDLQDLSVGLPAIRYFSRSYEARHRILIVFVQLCRSTRRKFLPWLWEHVQSLCFRSPGLEGRQCRLLAKTVFRRQSRTLITTVSLAAYVKVLSVHIIRQNAPGLVKLLPLLPNLNTLEALTEDYDPSIARSFKPIQIPRIHTLVIDARSHYLLRCCTNMKKAIIRREWFDAEFLGYIPSVANSLVYLAVCFPAPETVQGFALSCPNLEELAIVQPYSFQLPDCLAAVQGLSKLRVLEVVLPSTHDRFCEDSRPAWESRMKEHAITVLGNIQGHAKVLKMTSTDVLSRWEDIRDPATQITVIP